MSKGIGWKCKCGVLLRADVSEVGKPITCAECKRVYQVPDPSPARAPTPPTVQPPAPAPLAPKPPAVEVDEEALDEEESPRKKRRTFVWETAGARHRIITSASSTLDGIGMAIILIGCLAAGIVGFFGILSLTGKAESGPGPSLVVLAVCGAASSIISGSLFTGLAKVLLLLLDIAELLGRRDDD